MVKTARATTKAARDMVAGATRTTATMMMTTTTTAATVATMMPNGDKSKRMASATVNNAGT